MLVMPITGEVKLERGEVDSPGSGYPSRFSHASEVAQPGYYAVTLERLRGARRAHRGGARSACIATPSRPASRAHVLLDLRPSIYDYPGKVLWAQLRLRPDGTVTGFRETRGWAPGRRAVLCAALLAADDGHELHNTEGDVLYKGFPPPAGNAAATAARRTAARWSGCSISAQPKQPLDREGRDFPGERGERHRQPRSGGSRAGISTRRARTPRAAWTAGAGGHRGRRHAGANATQFLHRALPRAAGAEPEMDVNGHYRRPRQRGAPGRTASPTTPAARCGTSTARCIRC